MEQYHFHDNLVILNTNNNMAKRQLHLKKVKSGEGWEVSRTRSGNSQQICWGKTKALCLKQFKSMLNDIQPGVSLMIHNSRGKGKGKFTEERTYPRSSDPRKTKG